MVLARAILGILRDHRAVRAGVLACGRNAPPTGLSWPPIGLDAAAGRVKRWRQVVGGAWLRGI